jgi:hypothetical protein
MAKYAREDNFALQRTVTVLRDVLQKLKDVLQESQGANLPNSSSLVNTINDCLAQLEALEVKIGPGKGKRMMKD